MKSANITLAIVLTPLASAALGFDAKIAAQGGAGVAAGDYTQHLLNPAHLATFDDDDDFGTNFGFGVLLQDKDDLVNTAEQARDAINALEDTSGDYSAKAQRASSSIEDLAQKYLSTDAGGNAYVAIPNDIMPASVFVSGNLKMAAGVGEISQADLDALDDAIQNGSSSSVDVDTLNTEVAASAVMTVDVGVAAAKTVETPLPGVMNVGGAIKYQQVTLIDYSEAVADFDGDKLLDSETSGGNMNLDIGISYQHNEMLSFGLTGKNLISKTYSSKATDARYKVEPEISAGAGFSYGIATVVADLQLTTTGGYGAVQETRYASIGSTIDFWEHARLSVGFRSELEGNGADLVTAGVGISPWDMLGLNAAVMVGEDNAYGGALQLSAKF